MKRRVVPDKEYCIGCHLCELACLLEHSESKDLITAYREERVEKGLSACKQVHHCGPDAVAVSCKHCDEPNCVAACIGGALYKDPETGDTVYDREKCVGCWSCVMACPYGAIRRHPKEACIVKCDLCRDRDEPACVAACPNRALLVVEE